MGTDKAGATDKQYILHAPNVARCSRPHRYAGSKDLAGTTVHEVYGAKKPLTWRLFSTAKDTMNTSSITNVTIATQANIYFDGKCVSHGITLADGSKKTVGVVLPATLTFNTGAPEIMECVAGGCEFKLAGSDQWVKSVVGDKFSIPGNSRFEIRVSEAYHYICHFG
jgi:uncharacterized protein YaiE (UPF0345 family)